MKKMTSAELRSAFLSFFQERGHALQASSSLVPGNDPTLLFTNAGMVQFKDVFLGREKRDFIRAVSSQRCVRAGGKHNDLENVGYTARHHTFFEMLGNFSFGDYFKEEAIHFAWDFLTKELQIPQERLWVTVFDEDAEAKKIWLQDVGIDASRFSKIGAKDNFWSMGDVGPCGPCSEIFYDHGPGVAGGPPGTPEEEGDRYIEIWNLVFMQYDRSSDGALTPLHKPSVDTGMGLERIAAVLQNVHNNYEIDLFNGLITTAAKLANITEYSNSSLRVIADHIRSCAFLIVDGVMPSNEGRGYVLRRIIRRAIRHGYRLGIHEVFFFKLVSPLVKEMGDAYPELVERQQQVEDVLKKEEQRFAETLGHGMKVLESAIANLKGSQIPGETVFLLYDTYGFPVDLTADFAREQNLSIDQAGFEKAMQAQRERARSASQFDSEYNQDLQIEQNTEFTGYQHLQTDTRITALIKDGVVVDEIAANDSALLVLQETPFYAESGGQTGDTGIIESDGVVFEVQDTQKQGDQLFLHKGLLKQGVIKNGQNCIAKVDAINRQATALNHSATHLLHAALRTLLGEHVAQKGSLVNAERLRFDFSHYEPISNEQINEIEQMVNRQIRRNEEVSAEIMDKEAAVNAGAMALFGEKYGDQVRVLKIGDFSTELCGGTHVNRGGDIGFFKIISESGVAAGVRRIEAITGSNAEQWMATRNKALHDMSELLKSPSEKAVDKLKQLLEKNRALEKELDKVKAKMASSAGGELTAKAVQVGDMQVLAVKLDDVDPKSMRDMVDQLKNKLGSSAIVLATVKQDKVSLIAGVSKDQTKRLKAGDLVNSVAVQVGGKGGGRPDMAQAGGNDPSGLEKALQQVPEWVRSHLQGK